MTTLAKLEPGVKVRHNGIICRVIRVNPDGTANIRPEIGNWLKQNVALKELETLHGDNLYVDEPPEQSAKIAHSSVKPSVPKLVIPPPPKPFDYADLTVEARVVVQQKTGEIRERIDIGRRASVEIGQRLIEIKAHLGHGHWGAWLRTEFGWSDQTALNFMNVARMAIQIPNVLEFEDQIANTTLIVLAAPSTPPSARQEAVAILETGAKLPLSQAKELIASHQPIPAEPPLNTPSVDTETGEITGKELIVTEDVDEFGGRHKPKTNYTSDDPEGDLRDRCQTPGYALDPLLPFLNSKWVVWEPAEGEGLLVEAFYDSGFDHVITGDILTGQNFYDYEPDRYDCHVTNPPFSDKYKWLERCYQLGKPFALLLPLETLGAQKAQALFRQYGLELILIDKRINYKMPNKGWDGNGAQFPSAWFTWGLEIGQQLTYGRIKRDE